MTGFLKIFFNYPLSLPTYLLSLTPNLIDDVIHGVHVFAHVNNLIVKMGGRTSTGTSDITDDLSSFYPLPLFYIKRSQVAVPGCESMRMIDMY